MTSEPEPTGDVVVLPVIETERLILRALRPQDADDVFAYARDPEVARYTRWEPHQSIADARQFISRVRREIQSEGLRTWGVELRESGRVIGTAGFLPAHPRDHRIELAYAIGRDYWGRGLTTEAARALVDYAFTTLGVNRVEAMCDVPNVGSARVMEKVGMNFEGRFRQYFYVKGTYRDIKFYALLREDWLAAREAGVPPQEPPTSMR